MIKPRCPKCNSSKFEAQQMKIDGLRNHLVGIKCVKCHALITILDAVMSEKINIIGSKVNTNEANLKKIIASDKN